MIRHISIFQLKKETGRSYQKHAQELVELLLQVAVELPEALHYKAAVSVAVPAKELPKGAPVFGDVVQCMDFADLQTALQYPDHPAHIRLMEDTKEWVEQVTVIEFEV